VTIATNMAGRGVDVKLGGAPNTLETYAAVKSAGGLFVLGTERHEARRIDNQLRGRSGRQGDPGETQFYVSLEDNLMRVFASDMLKTMMGKLGMDEDQPIEHRLISKSLETAQEKIEGFNFDSRKHVLEFDDVINSQRTNIYARRRKLLLGSLDDVESELNAMITSDGRASSGPVSASADAAPPSRSPSLVPKGHSEALPSAAPEIQTIIAKKIADFGREAFLNAVRIVLLQTIDMYWVEHLEVMDYTRSSVNLRAYGQRDPLVEYKKEGLRLYREMMSAMQGQFVRILPNIVPIMNGQPVKNEIQAEAEKIASGDGSEKTRLDAAEPGRNDPCPCGSGKKYKKCGALNTPEHQKLMSGKKIASIYMSTKNGRSKGKRSVESLHHFSCVYCKKWWTIGDAPEKKLEWHCPWCGKKQAFERVNT